MIRNCLSAVALLICAEHLRAETIPDHVVRAWKRAFSELSQVNGQLNIAEGATPSDTVSFAFQGELARSEVRTQTPKSGTKRIAALRTARFEFGLSEASPDRWQLSRVFDRGDRSPMLLAHEKIVKIAFGAYLECSLLEAIESSEFVVQDWTETENKATFVLQRVKEIGVHHFDRLFVQLDSKHSYRVAEAGLAMNERNNGKPITKLVYEYMDDTTNEIWTVIPKNCSLKVVESGSTVFKYSYSDLSTNPLSPEEFTLAHYGIPEYEEDSRSPTMLYLAFGTGIGLLLVLAAYVRKESKRQRQR